MDGDSKETTSDRLESWKEVARYLKRDVTTVQRWERQEALPVRRLMHSRSGSVYAFRAELDAWRDAHEGRPRLSAPPEPVAATGIQARGWRLRRVHRVMLYGGAVATSTIVLAFAIVAERRPSPPSQSTPAFEWLLSAKVDDETHTPQLASAIAVEIDRALLARHLPSGPSPARIQETLRLMRAPSDTPITETVAREIAFRDPEIGGVILPSLSLIGARYVLQARIVEPDDGQTVAVVTREFASPERAVLGAAEVAAEVARLSAGVPSSRGLRTPRVTTASTDALQLYSKAVLLGEAGQWNAAEQLGREALEKDPSFASAANWVGWSLFNQGDPEGSTLAAAVPFFQRAIDLGSGVTDAERYFAIGSLHTVSDRSELALRAYQAVLKLQPDHYWAANNAGFDARRLRRWSEGAYYLRLASDSRPDDCGAAAAAFFHSVEAARSLVDLSRLRDRIRRLVGTLPDGTPDWAACRNVGPDRAADLMTFDGRADLVAGNLRAALHEARLLSTEMSAERGALRARLAQDASDLLFGLGRPQEAAESIRNGAGPEAKMYSVISAYERGQLTLAVRGLRAIAMPDIGFVGDKSLLESRLGFTAAAREGLARRLAADPELLAPGLADLAAGGIAAAEGRLTEARQSLERGVEQTSGTGYPAEALGAQTLAQVYRSQGDRKHAIRVLEEASRDRTAMTLHGAMDFWLLIRNDLCELYREDGRLTDALAVEGELRNLLAVAEPDQIVKRRLDRLP